MREPVYNTIHVHSGLNLPIGCFEPGKAKKKWVAKNPRVDSDVLYLTHKNNYVLWVGGHIKYYNILHEHAETWLLINNYDSDALREDSIL